MNQTTFSINGRIALITGASRGLGAAIAKVLAGQGAKVLVNYFQGKEAAQTVVSQIRENGGQAEVVQGDIMSEEGCRGLVEEASKIWGAIDILVCNATPPQTMLPVASYSAQDYKSMLDAFVMSPFHLTQAVLPGMREQQWGRIINITSEVTDTGITDYSSYVAAKGGQQAWTECIARELAPCGITVNSVAPGWIPLKRFPEVPAEAMQAYTDTVPAGRMGVPEDVAHAVAFFASEEANFINGQSLAVNGANTTG